MCMYIMIYIYIYTHLYIYIYIYNDNTTTNNNDANQLTLPVAEQRSTIALLVATAQSVIAASCHEQSVVPAAVSRRNT